MATKSKYTDADLTALRKKETHPDEHVFCPRCGEEVPWADIPFLEGGYLPIKLRPCTLAADRMPWCEVLSPTRAIDADGLLSIITNKIRQIFNNHA